MISSYLQQFLPVCGVLEHIQQEGHDNNWIYDNGPVSGPIKGAKSHYYNEWRWDSDADTSGDFVTGANVPEEDTEVGVDPSGNLVVANERVSASPPHCPLPHHNTTHVISTQEIFMWSKFACH